MLHFELVSLAGVKFKQTVHEVILPTPQGNIAVFNDHMPLISVASQGVIMVRVKDNDPDDFMEAYATNGGLIEITGSSVRVLVDEADHSEDIVEAEARAAHEAAKQALKDAKDPLSLETAQSMIDKTALRLRVAGLKRRKQRR